MTNKNDDGDGDDDIPLDITGHEERDPPGETSLPDDDSTPTPTSDTETPAPATAGSGTSTNGAHSGTGDEGESERNNGDSDDNGDDKSEPANTERKAEAETGTNGEANAEADDEASAEVRPVEVLVSLAKDGEIEPWDIDIVTVTDKFLDRLDEADLRTSGRALFYASVLLRMKSDAMLNEGEENPEPEQEPWEAAAMDGNREALMDVAPEAGPDASADPFASLEQEMDRRLERKRARGMPQTLDELVRELREAERDTWWKESREYDTSESPHGFSRGTQELDYRSGDDLRMDDEPTEADVTGAAHAEDIDTIIDDVYGVCLEQWDAGRDEVLYAEIAEAGGSRVETFLGLLFLSHRGQVHLQQDELFGDLWVQDPNAPTGSEEAIAD